MEVAEQDTPPDARTADVGLAVGSGRVVPLFVTVALGSVGPTVLRANGAERSAAQAMTTAGAWDEPGAPVGPHTVEGFAERVSAAAEPVDDVRGTAAYRRHACRVLARRAFEWALRDRLNAGVG